MERAHGVSEERQERPGDALGEHLLGLGVGERSDDLTSVVVGQRRHLLSHSSTHLGRHTVDDKTSLRTLR